MPQDYIHISIGEQRLRLWQDDRLVAEYPVSTARKGPGERMGSEQTPRGWHRIRARIGAGCAPGTVFVGRRATGELYSPALAAKHPRRDWILTRILWLCGSEPGKNRFGKVDTMRRFIYIHGCPDDQPMGQPGSHGCIRMRNQQLIEFFDRIPAGMPLLIEE